LPTKPSDGSAVSTEESDIFLLLSSLFTPKERGQALAELSRKRETCEELGVFIWNSFGVVTVLLQEVMSVYPLLQPPNLTNHASNRVCDALALLQCVASHPETRLHFLNGNDLLLKSGTLC
jgi:CCR4-NOT transcription complex subunit 9